MNEDAYEKSVNIFETIVNNLEIENSKNTSDIWYLNSGATKHVSRNKSSFKGLNFFVKIHNVKFIGGQIHDVHEKGKIKISSNFSKIKIISNVFYVPSLSKNLLFINMIADKGNIVVFDSKKCLVINNGDPNIIMVEGVKDQKNGLY